MEAFTEFEIGGRFEDVVTASDADTCPSGRPVSVSRDNGRQENAAPRKAPERRLSRPRLTPRLAPSADDGPFYRCRR